MDTSNERPTCESNPTVQGGSVLKVITPRGVQTHQLPAEGERVIGRSAEADIVVDEPSISRRHAALTLERGEMFIRDLGSKNGTSILGRKLDGGERTRLAPGQPIDLGSAVLIAHSGSPAGISETIASPETGAMAEVLTRIALVAKGNISVILLGETGVGKEVLADRIHRQSRRSDKPMVRLNCAALSEALLESELFGHEKGAFSGAVQTKPGLLEIADGGTVFLDEIGELPLSLQAKLLRVLEQRQVRRVGGLAERSIDVRFIAATNRDIDEEIRQKRFRQDLFYRLNGVSIAIPPLRERREEIGSLAQAFIAEACREAGRSPEPRLSPQVFAFFQRYAWPGNIRELRHVIERAVLFAGNEIQIEHVMVPSEPSQTAPRIDAPTLDGVTDSNERMRIIDALGRCAGNQTHAARLLGISRSTLVSRIAAYAIPRPRKRPAGPTSG